MSSFVFFFYAFYIPARTFYGTVARTLRWRSLLQTLLMRALMMVESIMCFFFTFPKMPLHRNHPTWKPLIRFLREVKESFQAGHTCPCFFFFIFHILFIHSERFRYKKTMADHEVAGRRARTDETSNRPPDFYSDHVLFWTPPNSYPLFTNSWTPGRHIIFRDTFSAVFISFIAGGLPLTFDSKFCPDSKSFLKLKTKRVQFLYKSSWNCVVFELVFFRLSPALWVTCQCAFHLTNDTVHTDNQQNRQR